jgi:hypothetical protein
VTAKSSAQALKTVLLASMALAFGLTDIWPSSAECGGYCEARQVRAICHRALATQNLEAYERDAEFEKCKADPMRYLVEPVAGEAGIGSN